MAFLKCPNFRNGDKISGCQELIKGGAGRKYYNVAKEGNMRNYCE